ncbi:hypothetical protein [Streptomyces alkaliterrae]|uniref:hypothetical protein n=1 Tax=Streptomyces alkaliterrae TaxID=2213162 RepID=UPI001E51BBF2|nr:hypothetical protein [Streptomyces alkaliterrae]
MVLALLVVLLRARITSLASGTPRIRGQLTEYVHGFTAGGTAGKNVAAGDYRGSVWAGSCFEPQEGDWVFVNIQSPGITFAMTGPWADGGL